MSKESWRKQQLLRLERRRRAGSLSFEESIRLLSLRFRAGRIPGPLGGMDYLRRAAALGDRSAIALVGRSPGPYPSSDDALAIYALQGEESMPERQTRAINLIREVVGGSLFSLDGRPILDPSTPRFLAARSVEWQPAVGLRPDQVYPVDYGPASQILIVSWLADVADRVLPVFERLYSKDERPRAAIAAARDWVDAATEFRAAVTAYRDPEGQHALTRIFSTALDTFFGDEEAEEISQEQLLEIAVRASGVMWDASVIAAAPSVGNAVSASDLAIQAALYAGDQGYPDSLAASDAARMASAAATACEMRWLPENMQTPLPYNWINRTLQLGEPDFQLPGPLADPLPSIPLLPHLLSLNISIPAIMNACAAMQYRPPQNEWVISESDGALFDIRYRNEMDWQRQRLIDYLLGEENL